MLFRILILLSLSGCFGKKPFQPPPLEYQQWVKVGVSADTIKQIMLECGFDNSHGNAKMDDNSYAKAQNCMIKKGFKHTGEFNICVSSDSYNLPACR
ncbi:MAG: hypothetical protein K0R08_2154 [Solimicrobium sp.]|jgi:hypothetical protein|nr:hypothetical protein [Solimicrobium sp.]